MNTGMEYEDILMRNQELMIENSNLKHQLNKIAQAPYCAFVRNGWIERMVFVQFGLTYEFMQDCPDLMEEVIAKEIRDAMTKATKPSNGWTMVEFKQEDKQEADSNNSKFKVTDGE